MNKKAIFGTTFTWFVATIIIVFIFLVWFVFLAMIYPSKQSTSDGVSYIKLERASDSSLGRQFFSFLNSEIEFNSQKIKIVDLVANRDVQLNELDFAKVQNFFGTSYTDNSNLSYFAEFKLQSDKFLESISNQLGNSAYDPLTYSTSFIRIYSNEDSVTRLSSSSTYEYFNSENYPSDLTSFNFCNPESADSFVVESYVSADKKIVFCVEHKK